MKKTVITLSICLLILATYVAIGPLLAINGIQNSIQESNSEALSEYVDFSTLRKNLKEQINAQMAEEVVDESDNPFMFAAAGFASMFVDKMLDGFVTPEGITRLLEGKKTNINSETNAESSMVNNTDFLENTSFEYNSFNRFTLIIHGENNSEVLATFRRYGLSWKLSNIKLQDL